MGKLKITAPQRIYEKVFVSQNPLPSLMVITVNEMDKVNEVFYFMC